MTSITIIIPTWVLWVFFGFMTIQIGLTVWHLKLMQLERKLRRNNTQTSGL
jgi:hypothetical protein